MELMRPMRAYIRYLAMQIFPNTPRCLTMVTLHSPTMMVLAHCFMWKLNLGRNTAKLSLARSSRECSVKATHGETLWWFTIPRWRIATLPPLMQRRLMIRCVWHYNFAMVAEVRLHPNRSTTILTRSTLITPMRLIILIKR